MLSRVAFLLRSVSVTDHVMQVRSASASPGWINASVLERVSEQILPSSSGLSTPWCVASFPYSMVNQTRCVRLDDMTVRACLSRVLHDGAYILSTPKVAQPYFRQRVCQLILSCAHKLTTNSGRLYQSGSFFSG